LTEIRCHHYSGGMVSELHQLAEKVSQLVELAQALRRENGDLRLSIAALTSENADLSQRIQEGYQRVAALLEKIPASDESENAA